MPETFFPAGLVLGMTAGVLGVFIAREFNLPYYVIIPVAIIMTGLGYPLIQLAGGVALAVAVARLADKVVTQVS